MRRALHGAVRGKCLSRRINNVSLRRPRPRHLLVLPVIHIIQQIKGVKNKSYTPWYSQAPSRVIITTLAMVTLTGTEERRSTVMSFQSERISLEEKLFIIAFHKPRIRMNSFSDRTHIQALSVRPQALRFSCCCFPEDGLSLNAIENVVALDKKNCVLKYYAGNTFRTSSRLSHDS